MLMKPEISAGLMSLLARKQTLLFFFFTFNTAMAQLTEDLKNITAWCCSNRLLINPDKTKLLVFGTRQMLEKVPSNFKASRLGKDLLPVPTAKDLGFVIDSCLSFNEHVTQKVSKCIASLSQINRMKYALDRDSNHYN